MGCLVRCRWLGREGRGATTSFLTQLRLQLLLEAQGGEEEEDVRSITRKQLSQKMKPSRELHPRQLPHPWTGLPSRQRLWWRLWSCSRLLMHRCWNPSIPPSVEAGRMGEAPSGTPASTIASRSMLRLWSCRHPGSRQAAEGLKG